MINRSAFLVAFFLASTTGAANAQQMETEINRLESKLRDGGR